jgi:hypothetical protein
MKIKINNKKDFIQNFLNPISKINDLCSIIIDNNYIYSFNRTSDSTFTLFSSSSDIEFNDAKRIISFAEIKKFAKAFECIPQETDIILNLKSNYIQYESHVNKFKFHLINDEIVRGPNYSLEKLNSLKYNTNFKLSYNYLISLIKSSTFITTEKIYIFTQDNKVYGELTDKTKSNVDSYVTIISDSYEGDDIQPLAFDFNIFRNMIIKKDFDVNVNINTSGIVEFTLDLNNYKLKYIATAHVS